MVRSDTSVRPSAPRYGLNVDKTKDKGEEDRARIIGSIQWRVSGTEHLFRSTSLFCQKHYRWIQEKFGLCKSYLITLLPFQLYIKLILQDLPCMDRMYIYSTGKSIQGTFFSSVPYQRLKLVELFYIFHTVVGKITFWTLYSFSSSRHSASVKNRFFRFALQDALDQLLQSLPLVYILDIVYRKESSE